MKLIEYADKDESSHDTAYDQIERYSLTYDKIQSHKIEHNDIDEPSSFRNQRDISVLRLRYYVYHPCKTKLHSTKDKAELHQHVLCPYGDLQEWQGLKDSLRTEPCTCKRSPYYRHNGEHIKKDIHIRRLLRLHMHQYCNDEEHKPVSRISYDHRKEKSEEKKEIR